MGDNNVKVTGSTRSPYDRDRAKDRLSFFKLQTRTHLDRRRVKDRRSHHREEFIGHIPERRKNMVGRRMIADRRGVISRYYEYFVGKSALIINRKYFGK